MVTEALAGALVLGSLIQLSIFSVFAFLVYTIFRMVLCGTKSQQHRKLLTNLYVSGKIRQLAKKDDIDLNEELKELLRTLKEQRKYNKSLDDTVELELQEKIMKEAELEKK